MGGRFDNSGNPVALIAERWNGTTWTVQPTPSPAGEAGLSAVACSGPASCAAVGLTSTNGGGKVLAERWNGTKWQVQPTLHPWTIGQDIFAPCSGLPDRHRLHRRRRLPSPGTHSVTLAEQWRGTA